MDRLMPDVCRIELDANGYSTLSAALAAGNDCIFPPEWRGIVVSATVSDKHGHELDGDYDPLGRGGCDHQETPEWRAEHSRTNIMARKHKSESSSPVEDTHSEALAAPVPAPVEEAKPVQTATIASIAAVPEAGLDMAKFLPAGNQSGTVAVVLGVLAVGGAAVKFLPNILKTRTERVKLDHEARMKELELREGRSKSDEERDQACGKRHGELAIKVALLESKLGPLEARASEAEARAARAEQAASEAGRTSIDLDGDELEEKLEGLSKRLTKIETAFKKKAR